MALSRSEDYSAAPTNDDDDDDEEVDDTTVDKFNTLRRLEGKARSDEIAKYLDTDGDSSLLRFLDKNRILSSLRLSLAGALYLILQGRRSRSQHSPSTLPLTVIFGRVWPPMPPHGWPNSIETTLVTSLASNI